MTETELLRRIYPSVVTFVGDWKKMVKDVSRLGLREISLFLTGVGFRERQEIYKALEKTSVKHIPHVHIRHDMKEQELDYLVKRFKSKVFTIHYQYIKNFRNFKHLKRLFIESNRGPGRIKSLKPFEKIGGICIDLSHMAKFKIVCPKDYLMADKVAKKFKVGCNHISAFNKKNCRAWHQVKKISELDYLKDMPKNYFSKYINIELANSISEQLKFKKYIAKLLAKTWK